jgi:hypothetical protein
LQFTEYKLVAGGTDIFWNQMLLTSLKHVVQFD